MNIVDWFDVESKDHIEAYSHLCHNGTWPENFLPKDIEFSHTWQSVLAMKMAEAYCSRILLDRIFESLYQQHEEDSLKWLALKIAGVEKWEGFEKAMKIFEQLKKEDEEDSIGEIGNVLDQDQTKIDKGE